MDVFEDFSILTEKQRLKPKNSSSLKFSASFDTHLDPRGAILVERNDLRGKYPCVCCVINEFNPTFETQNMGNEAFENASFGNASFGNGNEDYSCLWALCALIMTTI